MIRDGDLDLLGCPDCAGAPVDLLAGASRDGRSLLAGGLSCARCGSVFPIEGSIPWLLPAGLMGARRHGIESFPEEWRRWGERLDGFRHWRERTWKGAGESGRSGSERTANARREAFGKFCGARAGRILESGCGDGNLRAVRAFSRAEYWGVDPMPIESFDYDFPFVAGVGERLPFRSAAFEAVIVKESLHHFHEPGRFLDEARRVTAAGGALLLCQGVEEAGPAASGAAARVALSRAATAARLLMHGEFREFRERMGRVIGTDSAGTDTGPASVTSDDHVMWHPTRNDIESEVRKRFEVEASVVEAGILYLKAKAGPAAENPAPRIGSEAGKLKPPAGATTESNDARAGAPVHDPNGRTR